MLVHAGPFVVARRFPFAAIVTAMFLGAASSPAAAQVGDPLTPRVHAIVGARIVTAPGRVIERGTIVIRDGLIEAVGGSPRIPADARVWNAESLTVYAGLIDPWVTLPPPKAEAEGGRRGAAAEKDADKGARHENPKIRPEETAATLLPLDREFLEARRAQGFAVVNLARNAGILRGSSVVTGLTDLGPRETLIAADATQVAALETGSWNSSVYPGSLMGAIALIRQTLSDAGWYAAVHSDYTAGSARRERPETNAALEALSPVLSKKTPLLFPTQDIQNMFRASRLAEEFGVNAVLLASGHEYKRLEEIAAMKRALLVPVDFPEPPSLRDKAAERAVDTADLRHWALAPGNPAAVDKSGLQWAFTTDGLKEVKDFSSRVREAIDRGLPPERALHACTVAPATILGLASKLGTIEPGKIASLVVTKGDLFGEKTEIREVWIDGRRYDTSARKSGGDTADRKGGEGAGAGGGAKSEASDEKPAVSADQAASASAGSSSKKLSPAEASKSAMTDIAPAGLMGETESWRAPDPEQAEAVFIRNATIWTSSGLGRLENADLLVRKGKVTAIGKGLDAPRGAVIIDGTGRHVTPGLIDCHSHTAVSGSVNEGTNSVTAEVRIADVVNSETINIYRELAGGLTTVNLLHGSANAIGGQNAVIKMRWGALPDELMLTAAPPGIKFALGENPKQSNWGAQKTNRYPQTRMGVEQLIRERFLTALDYRRSFSDFKAGKGPRPRRDYQLEALQEILEGKRLIHSHSYRQDEILMLIRLCEQFGIRVATFQHVLEGYKVADEIAAHGAGASSFSDWWAYKFEVYDAIPYSGSIMRERGVSVSFNSDSSELARRMNYEAAKAVKYGGTPPEEALKFVTLNPASQLRVSEHVGSLEPGKDADFVVWNGDPLSNLTRCEQTWVDGRKYFDREEDLKNRPVFEKERENLIAWAKKTASKEGGAGSWSARQHPGYLDEDGSDDACHHDGTDRHEAVHEGREAQR